MKNFLLMPDSFKGTMSSVKVCQIMTECINEVFPKSEIRSVPVADGGEGSVDCFLTALGGEKVSLVCNNPYFEKMTAFYGLINQGKIGIVEMSASAGLPLVEDRKNPLKTSTYGVGEIVKDALNKGVEEIILGLGGSCTNDFGAGFACALGVKFKDENGNEFIPVGGTLSRVRDIDLSGIDEKIKNIKITVMCDVDNPPFGKEGASYVFARQKGANDFDIELLDNGIKHICNVVKEKFGKDLSTLKGGGAAGAMASGLVAFFGAELKMGIETVLDVVNFDKIVNQDTIIFTGEGKIDSQSIRGKVISGVAKRAQKFDIPVIVVAGGAEGDLSSAYDVGINSIFTINRLPEDFSVSKYKSEINLKETFKNILRLMKISN